MVKAKKYWNLSKKGDDKKLKMKKSKKEVLGGSDNEMGIDLSKLDLSQLEADAKEESIERDANHIYFYSEVSRDSIFKLNMLINECEDENLVAAMKFGLDPIPIYLHINSFGGNVYAALACIDVIQSCKVPVYTICEGAIASAGTLISVVGAKRYMRPNAYLLIHQLSSGFWGKMSEMEDEFMNLKALMKRIKSIYKKHCKIPKRELNEILKHDLWWDADKCLEVGLVDGLWPNSLNKRDEEEEDENIDDE